ncbi:hypothetical protein [Arthrobacter sp. DR-2P]|nr:hypothetical protein [Arthrobacter sp. DR-2P]
MDVGSGERRSAGKSWVKPWNRWPGTDCQTHVPDRTNRAELGPWRACWTELKQQARWHWTRLGRNPQGMGRRVRGA